MDQIVSLVKDQQAHFAYVDHDTGQIVPFADILIPDEERFGLIEAAGLGSSLVDFLGLNGSKRPVARTMTVGSSLEARRRAAALEQAEDDEVMALNAPPDKRTESVAERKRRIARESYHRNKGNVRPEGEVKRGPGRPRKDGSPNTSRPDLLAQVYVPGDWVWEVINQYPEGISARDIGERIWRTKLNGGDGEYPRWITRSVENRITAALTENKAKGKPLPFVVEARNTPGGMKRRVLKPVSTPVADRDSLFSD